MIVLPDQARARPRRVSGRRAAAQYTGGLGSEGVAALRTFVEEGGTLVAVDSASASPSRSCGLPVRDALAQCTRPGRRAAPEAPPSRARRVLRAGSLLEARPAADDPLVDGAEAPLAVWFESSSVFDGRPRAARVVLRYPARNPLLSGWLIGPEKWHGLGALVEAPLGSGRVVLFGFRPQYRAQTWGTYVLLLNALYRAALEAPPAPAPRH